MTPERAAVMDTGLSIDHIRRITDQLAHLPIVALTTLVQRDPIGSHGEFDTIYVRQPPRLQGPVGVPRPFADKTVVSYDG